MLCSVAVTFAAIQLQTVRIATVLSTKDMVILVCFATNFSHHHIAVKTTPQVSGPRRPKHTLFSQSTIQAEATNSMSSGFDEMLAVNESPEYYSSLPLLPQGKFFLQPAPSPTPKDSYTVYATSPKVSAVASSTETSGITQHAKNDTTVSSRPSRQVDYLSHDWKREDI